MTALTADAPGVDASSGPALHGTSAVRTTSPDRPDDPSEDRSASVTSSRSAVRSWPLLALAVPAAAEVWSGWVGIARLTGFGMVSPLPGIWPSLYLDTSITLPVGVEAYAAYALRAWLAAEQEVSPRTRRFAKRSAMCSFALGMAGQVTYHLLAGAGITRAPWPITTIVSCLPVLVLVMGTTLAHMLRADTAARDRVDSRTGPLAAFQSLSWSVADQDGPDRSLPEADRDLLPGRDRSSPSRGPRPDHRTACSRSRPVQPQADQARTVARDLVAAGKQVSRRTLRSGGVTGSNETLNALAREINTELTYGPLAIGHQRPPYGCGSG